MAQKIEAVFLFINAQRSGGEACCRHVGHVPEFVAVWRAVALKPEC